MRNYYEYADRNGREENVQNKETEKKKRKSEQRKKERRMAFLFAGIASTTMVFLIVTAFFLGRMSKSMEVMNINTDNKTMSVEKDMNNNTANAEENTATAAKYIWKFENQMTGNKKVTEAVNNDILTLVNPTHRMPENWSVDLVDLINDQSIDRRAYEDLQNMMDDCRAEGLHPLICSSYRSHEKQIELYENKVNRLLEEGYEEDQAAREAERWIAVPGTSEHELGLAVDIVDESYQMLDDAQADTQTQIWLMNNSYRYGYILRYPADKADITGISYEPWHYRYVGKDAAEYMYENDLCMEEYFLSR